MVKQKLCGQTDPKDAKKIALSTKIEVLESASSTSAINHPRGDAGGSGGDQYSNKIPFIIPGWKKKQKQEQWQH